MLIMKHEQNIDVFYIQAKKGYMTESDTDTEVIVKLLKLIYDRDQQSGNEKKLSFPELVEQVILQLVRTDLPQLLLECPKSYNWHI